MASLLRDVRGKSHRSRHRQSLSRPKDRLRNLFHPAVEALETRHLLAASVFRTIDGTGNNLAHPEWGSTDEQLLRRSAAEYADGISAPAGTDRPSAREISNAIVAHIDEDTPNNRDLTAYLYIWGQFLDHDLDLTQSASPKEVFNVLVPGGDEFFDSAGTGTQVIPLNRSIFDAATCTSAANPRQQINQITAWIDGSMIYGSDAATAASLRTFAGGKMKTSAGNLPLADAAGNFVAGDVRANENIELTSLHALFVREHNRLATQIAAANRGLSDEEIYQRARVTVIGEIQVITYKEWLPALLGAGALSSYRGYNANVNPGIANEFSTAAFRLHSTINDDVEFFDNSGRPITFTYVNDAGETIEVDGEIALSAAFNNPTLLKQSGVDGILKYAASTHAEEIDNQIVDSLRNFLFGLPGQGGLDLASLNIQRGRDHGLADYNAVRVAFGLPAVTSFAQISSDPGVQQQLQDLYGDVNNIDLWVGGLAEDHVRGSSVGPLFQRIIADQFQRLRDGDRFWYQRAFSGQELSRLEQTTLADVIRRNTGVSNLQGNVFFFQATVSGQVFADANSDGRFSRGESGQAGVTVELLNDEQAVIASAVTTTSGQYRFTQFGETGDYHVRFMVPTGSQATTATTRDLLISRGGVSISGVNFGLQTTVTQPPTTGAFDVQFVFSGLTASQRTIFEQAATKWESIIVGDLPNVTFNGQTIDDVQIAAAGVSIDGSGGTLGQAGPDRFRSGSQLPYHGTMQFDTADLASLEATGQLLSVILHEMGHVLGIGTLWSNKGLLVGANTSNPGFTGTQEVAAYNSLFGTSATAVPVENSGGSGTRNAHWRESIFGNELMTGFLNSGNNPLSRVTVASLADLGYSVNLAAADAYSPLRSSSVQLFGSADSGAPTGSSAVMARAGNTARQVSWVPRRATAQQRESATDAVFSAERRWLEMLIS